MRRLVIVVSFIDDENEGWLLTKMAEEVAEGLLTAWGEYPPPVFEARWEDEQ